MEKIVVKIEVDGVPLKPLALGKGKQHFIYEDDMQFFLMGHLFNVKGTLAPYEFTISLTRHKTTKEKKAR